MNKSSPLESRKFCLIFAVLFSLFLVSITSAIWYALVKYDLILDSEKCPIYFTLKTSLAEDVGVSAESLNVTEELPENFDCREKWPRCSYMQQPTVNQGSCGSCWAVATTSAMSDRICVASNMTVDVQLSAFDVVSCQSRDSSGCSAGYVEDALDYFKDVGIVTGGSYGSIDGCKPYGFNSSCGSPCSLAQYEQQTVPVCEENCRNGYRKTYEEDLYNADQWYYLTNHLQTREKTMKQMQGELYERGPIIARFVVHEDFLLYQSGVYRKLKGDVVYGHFVRVVGWGVENGVPYWTAANSWGRDWGENGFFRIVRGENEVGFEDQAYAATIDMTTLH